MDEGVSLMTETALYTKEQAEQDPYEVPLETIDPANPFLFSTYTEGAWFKRLRDESPVHFCPDGEFGPYWSITRYDDIMTVDTSHDLFSSQPAIGIRDQEEDFKLPMFIAMDRPKHDEQRKAVTPGRPTE